MRRLCGVVFEPMHLDRWLVSPGGAGRFCTGTQGAAWFGSSLAQARAERKAISPHKHGFLASALIQAGTDLSRVGLEHQASAEL